MNTYILKSYGLDSISCTGYVIFMGYKSLISSAHAITYLLVCRRGGGGGGDDNRHHYRPNTNEGAAGGVEQWREEEEVVYQGGVGKMEITLPRRGIGHFYDNIEC